MNAVVIVPSIRSINLDYLEPLGDTPVYIIDDTGGSLKVQAPHHHIFVASEWEHYLPKGTRPDLIPQHSPSCKDLGLYLAWKEGFETIILLDDDCDTRVSPNYLQEVPVGQLLPAHPYTTPSGWCNTLQLLSGNTFHARGYPYEHRDESMTISPTELLCSSKFNEGLWCGTPDINGIDKLRVRDEGVTDPYRTLTTNRVVLDTKQKLPLSIMNVQLHRDLIPAFYQPPDYPIAAGFRIRRHDDVWSMYLLKRCMDARRDVATVGVPLIHHRKAGDMVQEALSEHVTNLLQPVLFQRIDRVTYLSGSYATMATKVGEILMTAHAPGAFQAVIRDYGRRCADWAALFC